MNPTDPSLYGATCWMPSNAQLGIAASTCDLSARASKGRHSPYCACSATTTFSGPRLVHGYKRTSQGPSCTVFHRRTPLLSLWCCPSTYLYSLFQIKAFVMWRAYRWVQILPCVVTHRTTSDEDLSRSSRAAAISSALYPCHRGSCALYRRTISASF